ncbi:hypothetical protein PR048_007494 [Dryococelus australis]|uniref:DDRGK domain-containing protein 1 n=1 Tax=Dryococelus australis TaxID=614101 RepID=A0ABQ9HVA9_9NEOP|nr:hypothetical protein PR048_007494 [Dryococelus australis]
MEDYPGYAKEDGYGMLQTAKVVLLEDLAAHFKLKTQSIIDRIHDLQSDGSLTGQCRRGPALLNLLAGVHCSSLIF